MERQVRTGYGVAAVLILSGAALFAAGAFSIVPAPAPPLQIGTNLWLGYEPFHLARAGGHLPDDVTLVEGRSSPALMEAVAAGSLDGAALTMDEVMRLEAAGQPMAVLALLDVSNGADMVLARSKVVADRGPAGLRIGVEMDGVGAFVLHRFLERRGLTVGRVQVVPVSASDHADAFDRLGLDYLVSYEPLASRLLDQGAVRVFDSADMKGEVVDVLAIRRDRMAGRQTTLRRLLAAWYQGVALLKGGEAAWMDKVARRQGLSPAKVRQVLQGLDFPDGGRSRAVLTSGGASLEPVRRWLVTTGAAQRLASPTLDPSYLPEQGE